MENEQKKADLDTVSAETQPTETDTNASEMEEKGRKRNGLYYLAAVLSTIGSLAGATGVFVLPIIVIVSLFFDAVVIKGFVDGASGEILNDIGIKGFDAIFGWNENWTYSDTEIRIAVTETNPSAFWAVVAAVILGATFVIIEKKNGYLIGGITIAGASFFLFNLPDSFIDSANTIKLSGIRIDLGDILSEADIVLGTGGKVAAISCVVVAVGLVAYQVGRYIDEKYNFGFEESGDKFWDDIFKNKKKVAVKETKEESNQTEQTIK